MLGAADTFLLTDALVAVAEWLWQEATFDNALLGFAVEIGANFDAGADLRLW